jgi:two-component system, cell cycle sensor histidine kinase and response regulator CckA
MKFAVGKGSPSENVMNKRFNIFLTGIGLVTVGSVFFSIAHGAGWIAEGMEVVGETILIGAFVGLVGYAIHRNTAHGRIRIMFYLFFVCLVASQVFNLTDEIASLNTTPVLGKKSPLNNLFQDTFRTLGLSALLTAVCLTIWAQEETNRKLEQAGEELRRQRDRLREEAQEREKLETQLRQSQKMEAVGLLAGGVAHDFNNLLQAIMGYSELAQTAVEQKGEINTMLEQVLSAAQRAKILVRQLLAFSRRQVLKLEVVDMDDIVEELAKMIRRLIGEHIALSINSGSGRKQIFADRGQMEQILMNLCVNSRDTIPEEGGKISIEIRIAELSADWCEDYTWAAPGDYVELAVSDTGHGMSEEMQRRVFEPFYTTKEEGEGTGLGLSTVYGIVRQHNGIIDVTSEIGVGTRFRVYIPLTDRVPMMQERHDVEAPPGGDELILIAEDDDLVRNLTGELLREAGYSVLSAADGEEAIRVFDMRADDIALVLLDVVMPGCGGRAVYDHIQESGKCTPVLFASGYSPSAIHNQFVLEEGIELIQKPYGGADLLIRVRQMLDS